MRLSAITASAHPAGNRVDLTWDNPEPQRLPGFGWCAGGHPPDRPDDGVVVAHGTGLRSASDTGLQGETVYYYALFPFSENPTRFEDDPHNRAMAMATAPYDFAGRMYELLPAIYRRFDAARLPALTVAGGRGPGAGRPAPLPGPARVTARPALQPGPGGARPARLDRVDGRLLPLIGQWIGWPTDLRLPVDAQRNELPLRARAVPDRRDGPDPGGHRRPGRRLGGPDQGIRAQRGPQQPARAAQPLVGGAGRGRPGGPRAGVGQLRPRRAAGGRGRGRRLQPAPLPHLPAPRLGHLVQAACRRRVAVERTRGGPTGIDKHPTAAGQGDRLWLFWQG